MYTRLRIFNAYIVTRLWRRCRDLFVIKVHCSVGSTLSAWYWFLNNEFTTRHEYIVQSTSHHETTVPAFEKIYELCRTIPIINRFFEYLFRLLASILTIFRYFLKILTRFFPILLESNRLFSKSTDSQYTNCRFSLNLVQYHWIGVEMLAFDSVRYHITYHFNHSSGVGWTKPTCK
jgi:hypothetical protein